jgi:acetoin utilization protein AcuC
VSVSPGPLLVFGARSGAYDFGPHHPLTPLRFGPGIDLLRLVGAEPGLAPEPAVDDLLLRVHLPEYVAAVRRLSTDPALPGAMGVGLSDNPAFEGMHEAAASVVGGTVGAMEAVLSGRAEHAFHPGGGLHHAMPAKAWGFCVYNDPALAVVRARSNGLRVLYVDLDVHHGDGVQAMTYGDPGVMTLSFHESGRYLFPQTGFIDELGSGEGAGTAVNMPFEPHAGEGAWLPAVRALLPALAAVFGPDVVVSQHGCDTHARDPLAHLRVTTTGMAEAARLVDAVAHRWAGGRWLATGGGGYDAYRVVPRAWALTWLAGAHREPEAATPPAWRDRWSSGAAAFGTPGMPDAFLDPPDAGLPASGAQEAAEHTSLETLARVRAVALPRLVREAEDRGWWRPSLAWAGRPLSVGAAGLADAPTSTPAAAAAAVPVATPTVVELRAGDLTRLAIARRVAPPLDPDDLRALLVGALVDEARAVGAMSDGVLVGLAVAAPSLAEAVVESLLVVGVAPGFRGRGLGGALLRALVDARPAQTPMEARVGAAERDVLDPGPLDRRLEAARRLLAGAGFQFRRPHPDIVRDDPSTIIARLA